MQGSFKFENQVMLFWTVKSMAYKIDHCFFFNDVLQRSGF
jgi:hypothetical protein